MVQLTGCDYCAKSVVPRETTNWIDVKAGPQRFDFCSAECVILYFQQTLAEDPKTEAWPMPLDSP